jgi:hypothetical protein
VTVAPGDTSVTPLRFDHYPWSHSLLMVCIWGAAASLAYAWAGRPRRAALLLAPLALSHWLLDVWSHRPDIPVVPWNGPLLGLGLWQSLPLTLAVEGTLFLGAIAVYTWGRRPGLGFWSLMALLAVTYVGNLFGPPPPGELAIALAGIAILPLVWWWANRASVR